ncbi:MAG: hypothetical protein QM315_05695, partial [Bacillota bacterium]|nr:hypothetical protein [Bacillota bacterium]
MKGMYNTQYEGNEILCLDISNSTSKDKEKIEEHVNLAKEAVKQYPPKSALMITNVTNTGFDSAVSSLIKEYAQHNTPYVKASALVGISGLQKVILTAVKKITGRDYYLA